MERLSESYLPTTMLRKGLVWLQLIIICGDPFGRYGCPFGPLAAKTVVLLPLNLLKPNDIYICRTAALTSKRYILNIYSTNIHTEYFKHAA